MSDYYQTNPDDPEARVVLQEYNGLHPGDRVVYRNPFWRQPDGSYLTAAWTPRWSSRSFWFSVTMRISATSKPS
jgi:hypothetical protein